MAYATIEQSNDLLFYPKSRTSNASDSHIFRSRTWSEDLTKTWRIQINGDETIEERAQRYCVYFTMTPIQLRLIHQKFLNEVNKGLELHSKESQVGKNNIKCSLTMEDTYITENMLPKGTEKGTCVSVDIGSSEVSVLRAVKVELMGNNKIATSSVHVDLKTAISDLPKGLLDRRATASQLFDEIALLNLQKQEKIPVGISCGFPIIQRGIDSAILLKWTKGFETGRKTIDKVEGGNIGALLNCGFKRANLNLETKIVINDTVSNLISARYEGNKGAPLCCAALTVASGINGCYVLPRSTGDTYKYEGTIINCEIGSFDISLPVNDVDLEVDFADESTESTHTFEKMIGTAYIGELCRRLVVKVWQSKAPSLAWIRHSIPWLACNRVVCDTTSELKTTQNILKSLWDWDISFEERKIVHQLFRAVFERSAALAAVSLSSICVLSGRLQRAMGGLTCSISGSLYKCCPQYREYFKNYLSIILDDETANLINIFQASEGSAKGTAILAIQASQKM